MIAALQKGLAVLQKLAENDQHSGITELSTELDLTKSNTQRILRTLVQLGYARHDPATGRYSATLRMWEIGYHRFLRDPVRRAAAPHLNKLFQRCTETVFLCMADDTDVIYVDEINSPEPMRIFCSRGMRVPGLRTASGLAVLAFQDADVIQRAIDAERASPGPSPDLDRVHELLAQVRDQGYAISLSRFRRNVNSIAAPVYNASGQVVASLVITGPEERLTPDRLKHLAVDVTTFAMQTSIDLGYPRA